jgi:acyl-homoserine lactone acylase PvdQ
VCFAGTAAAEVDLSGPAFQILAPGDFGGLPPNENSFDQGILYNELTPLQGNVTSEDLEKFFLSEKFGVSGPVASEEHPEAGLVIKRDKNYIPHVTGQTRDEVMFGSGWIAAKDRGLLLALGLGPAYAAALDVPGINPFELLLTGRSFRPSVQAVTFVAAQRKSLIEKGPEGEQVLKDLEDWAQGVNAYESTLGPERLLPPLTATDAIAGFALIGSIFGNGGGNEVTNSNFLAGLDEHLGSTEGLKVFRDLREVNDPEAPVTTTKPFPYDGVPTGATPGAAVIDRGSASDPVAHAMATASATKQTMSNFLLAGPEHSASGHPLAVMGPQLGYFYPEIVMQGDLHGGGVDAQGAIAPISPYVFIGRARDFAWSLTSAGSENTQQFLEKLCEPGGGAPSRESTHYEFNGKCIAFNTVDAGILGPGNGEPEHEVSFLESVHGPISGTVTVGGQPYAVARDRSTRGREPAGELAFSDFDSNRVHSPEQFFKAANNLETTFNIPYVDSSHIAYFSAGRLPVLAPGTDPSLPTFGTGEYDWRGFLSQEQHPHEVMPKSDIFLNWNNKPAPEWGASSDNYSFGAVQRVQMYTGFKKGMSEADVASIMNRAATQDLRAVKDWPVIKQVLEASPAPSKLAEEAAGLVSTWAESGASRFGVTGPEDPGAAVLDAAFKPIAEAVLSPVLGAELTNEFASFNSIEDAPSAHGSSYDGGWYGYVSKDLRAELGQPIEGPYSRQYCGNGSLAACSTSLWAAIQGAAERLEKEQGADHTKWRAARVRILFPPTFLPLPPTFKTPFTMDWTNRSTFQQVITFTGAVSVISGNFSGPRVVHSGESVELTSTGKISGPVTVEPGGELNVEGGTISGPVKATGAAGIRLCGARISGEVVAINGTGPVVIGEGNAGCPVGLISGPVTLKGNEAGVVVNDILVGGPLTVANNGGGVTIVNDSLFGPVSVTGNTGGTTVTNNSVFGPLTVLGNAEPVVDKPNTVTGPSKLQ